MSIRLAAGPKSPRFALRAVARGVASVLALTGATAAVAGASEPPPSAPSAEAAIAAVEAVAAAARASATEETRAVIEADLAFARAARTAPVADVFAAWTAADGVLMSPGVYAVGPEAVRAAMAGSTAAWHWAPEAATASGDVGATRGVAALIVPGSEGAAPSVYQTRYVTVWRRGADGQWKMWSDTGFAADWIE